MPVRHTSMHRRAMGVAVGSAFGWLFAVLTLGPLAYSPTAREKFSDDRAMHLIGWDYYVADEWRWPPTGNPDYGEVKDSTLLFSDSLPLFSVPTKAVRAWLPAGAHPFNIWLGLAFALQAGAGVVIGQVLRLGRRWIAVLSVTVTAAPFFIERASFHLGLAGHGFVLLALAAYVAGTRGWPQGRLAWPLLLVLAVWTQPYLAALCGAVWTASMIQRWGAGSRRLLAIEAALVTAGAALSIVMLGATGGSGVVGDSLGEYRADVLSFVDPDQRSSTFVPDLVSTAGHERFVYLGLGVLALCPFALRSIWRDRRWKRGPMAPLAVVAAALLAFSMLGNLEVTGAGPFVHSISRRLNSTASIFRANARFAWLAGYLLIVGSVTWLARQAPRGRVGYVAAAAFLAVQLGDVGPAALTQKEVLSAHTHPNRSPLDSPFWTDVASHYDRVRAVPPYDGWTWIDWSLIPYFGAQNGLSVDSGWFARPRRDIVSANHADFLNRLADGRLDPSVLVFVQPSYGPEVLALRQPGDAVASIDGMTVLAPGWEGTLGPSPVVNHRRLDPSSESTSVLAFGADRQGSVGLNLGFTRRLADASFSVSRTALVAVEVTACAYVMATVVGPLTTSATDFTVALVGRPEIDVRTTRDSPRIVDLGQVGPGTYVVRLDTGTTVGPGGAPQGAGLRELRVRPC